MWTASVFRVSLKMTVKATTFSSRSVEQRFYRANRQYYRRSTAVWLGFGGRISVIFAPTKNRFSLKNKCTTNDLTRFGSTAKNTVIITWQVLSYPAAQFVFNQQYFFGTLQQTDFWTLLKIWKSTAESRTTAVSNLKIVAVHRPPF